MNKLLFTIFFCKNKESLIIFFWLLQKKKHLNFYLFFLFSNCRICLLYLIVKTLSIGYKKSKNQIFIIFHISRMRKCSICWRVSMNVFWNHCGVSFWRSTLLSVVSLWGESWKMWSELLLAARLQRERQERRREAEPRIFLLSRLTTAFLHENKLIKTILLF